MSAPSPVPDWLVVSPTLVKPLHGPEMLDAVAYLAWFGFQPVAAEVSMKNVLPRLNNAGPHPFRSRGSGTIRLQSTIQMFVAWGR